MSSNERERQLQQREQELRDRELSLRLQELEAEISQKQIVHQPGVYKTTPHQKPQGSLKRFYRKLANIAKFVAIVVIAVAAVRIASWLAGVIIVGGIAWLAYKIFFESDEHEP